MSTLTDHDIYLFREGTHARLYDKLGCQIGTDGLAHFAVWAPNARSVSLIGDFNTWDANAHVMRPRWDASGIWEASVAEVKQGAAYKFRIVSQAEETRDKGDPFAYYWEEAPRTASRVWRLDYDWNDASWMRARAPATRSTRRCRSTSSISGPGGAMRQAAFSVTARLQSRSSSTSKKRGSRTSS